MVQTRTTQYNEQKKIKTQIYTSVDMQVFAHVFHTSFRNSSRLNKVGQRPLSNVTLSQKTFVSRNGSVWTSYMYRFNSNERSLEIGFTVFIYFT